MNILRISIERPVFVTMIALFLATLGILALRSLPLDLYPNISYPILAVRTDLPGAAPEEIEQLITKRIEDKLSSARIRYWSRHTLPRSTGQSKTLKHAKLPAR
jgi:HAE1 family hydrophobic/amphiphilic exporter-1